MTTNTHPSPQTCRVPHHQPVVGNIPSDDGSSTNKRILSYRKTTDYRTISTQSGPLPDQGWAKLIHSGHFTARIKDVGENHRGTAEHSVFKGDSLVNRNIILDLDTVPYNHSRPQHDILPDPTVLADPRVFQNVRDMPDGGPFTDRDILVHKSGGVNKILFAPVARR